MKDDKLVFFCNGDFFLWGHFKSCVPYISHDVSSFGEFSIGSTKNPLHILIFFFILLTCLLDIALIL